MTDTPQPSAVTLTWHTPNTILFTLRGRWTWDEMYAGIDGCYTMMESVQHTVATIFDVREAEGLPANALTNMRQLNRRRHANSGKVVVVGLSAFPRVMLNTFARVYGFSNPNGVHFVETLDEALHLVGAVTAVTEEAPAAASRH
jgi:hypothetical protein